MKKQILLTALLGIITLSSCNKPNNTPAPGTYPENAAYVKTHIIAVDAADDSADDTDKDDNKYIFETDKGEKLFLVDNKMGVDFDFEQDDRIIVYFTILEEYKESDTDVKEGAALDCKYGIRLFSVTQVIEASNEVVTTEAESDAIADHALAYIYSNITLSYNYINMIAGIRADVLDDVRLYVVENQWKDPKDSDEDYLSLELRFDRASDEPMGSVYERYVSLDLTQYADRLKDLDGVMLRIRTTESGTKYIKLKKAKESKAVSRSGSML